MAEIGTLGDVPFYVRSQNGKNEIFSFHDMTRTASAEYAEHDRNGGKPYLEFNHPGLDEISLTVEANANYGINPQIVQEKLHSMAESGEAHDFVIGGKKVGNNPYVITGITDTYKAFYTDGRVTALSIELTLKEYANQVASIDTIPPATQIGGDGYAPAETNYDTYVVQKGDCLWAIARQFYGNGASYTKIYNANTDLISNPNLIYPGWVLKIPK